MRPGTALEAERKGQFPLSHTCLSGSEFVQGLPRCLTALSASPNKPVRALLFDIDLCSARSPQQGVTADQLVVMGRLQNCLVVAGRG
jgi:hypothetical protein